jgi:hypothetical protein
VKFRPRKPKVKCLLSYVEYRPGTNTSNIINTEHVSKSEIGRGDQGRRKRRKKRYK